MEKSKFVDPVLKCHTMKTTVGVKVKKSLVHKLSTP